jgi:hypothetical protein
MAQQKRDGTKGMEIGKWVGETVRATRSKLVTCRPENTGGATLYARLANWVPAPGVDPDYPPLYERPDLEVLRHVGLSTPKNRTEFSIRGYHFHADIDEGQMDIILASVADGREYKYRIETGYYDGFPLDVHQFIRLRAPDDFDNVGEMPSRWIRLYNYSTEIRARGDGALMFLPAGMRPWTVDALNLAFPLETIPCAALADWTPLHDMACFVGFVPYSPIANAVIEVRG